MNTADFIVEEVDDSIVTSMLPDNLAEDIYGGDDGIFEFNNNTFVKVCTQSKHI